MKCYKFLLLALTVLIASCSSTFDAYWRSLQLALKDNPDLTLSTQQVAEAPVDLIYFSLGDRPQAILALAFIEEGNFKWITADKLMFVEKQGRILKTIGFNHNLLQLHGVESDPIQSGRDALLSAQWIAKADYQDLTYGHDISYKITSRKQTSLGIHELVFDTILVEEQVIFDNKGLNQKGTDIWTNRYWYEVDSGRLLKTQQKLSPFSEMFDVTYVSRAIRLIHG